MGASLLVVDVRPLRESPAFRALFIARAVTLLDGGMVAVAVNVQVYRLTGSSAQVGLVSLALAAFVFLGVMLGGLLSDRVDCRRLLVVAGLGTSVMFGAMALNSFSDTPRLTVVYGCAVAAGLVFGVDEIALMAVTPRLVDDDQLTGANALTSLVHQFGGIGGPSLAGLLVAAHGPGLVYLISCLTAAASVALVLRVPSLPAATEPGADAEEPATLAGMAAGFRFIAGNRVITAVLLIDLFAVALAMPFALLPEHAERTLGGGAAAVGVFYTCLALGAFVGSLTSGWTGRVRRTGLVVVLTSLAWGAAIAGFGLASGLAWAAALLFVAGFVDSVSETVRRSLIQHRTPEHLQGRVGSVWLAQAMLGPSAGSAIVGFGAGLLGARAAITAGGLACVAGTAAIATAYPELRRSSLADPSADQIAAAEPSSRA